MKMIWFSGYWQNAIVEESCMFMTDLQNHHRDLALYFTALDYYSVENVIGSQPTFDAGGLIVNENCRALVYRGRLGFVFLFIFESEAKFGYTLCTSMPVMVDGYLV